MRCVTPSHNRKAEIVVVADAGAAAAAVDAMAAAVAVVAVAEAAAEIAVVVVEDPHEAVAHKADDRLQGARRRSSASNGGSLPFSDPILSGKL
jgi:hypothetical protein